MLPTGSTLQVGAAGEDTLLLNVGDDRGGGAEVGVLVQNRQVMMQCGSHHQVIRHGEPVMLALAQDSPQAEAGLLSAAGGWHQCREDHMDFAPGSLRGQVGAGYHDPSSDITHCAGDTFAGAPQACRRGGGLRGGGPGTGCIAMWGVAEDE